MFENQLRRINAAHPSALLQNFAAPENKVQIANDNIAQVRKQVFLHSY